MKSLLDSLGACIGRAHVLTQSSEVAPYVADWRGRYQGSALCVVRPASADEVAAVVRLCQDAKVAMVPQGGNTGLCGGATPRGGEVVISLTRMNRVRHVDADNSTITVEAGCTLQAVQEAAASVGCLFPLSIASEGTATIGGCLSTNAGGVQVLRYGNARDLALGLAVVLPDGRLWDGLRGLRKDNTGYDLKQLFIGAEGTLGMITAAVLKLFPAPRSVACGWVAIPDPEAAVRLLRHLHNHVGDRLTAFELIDRNSLALVLHHIPGTRAPLPSEAQWQVLIELSDPASVDLHSLLTQGLLAFDQSVQAVVANNETQRNALWHLRESISEAQRREGFSIKHDISVPVSRVAEFITAANAALAASFRNVRIVCFGHVGDGNLHYNLSLVDPSGNADFIGQSAQVNRVVYDIAAMLDGSISAEHGLGQLKRDEIKRYKNTIELSLMQSIKHSMDPDGLMNPGKVL